MLQCSPKAPAGERTHHEVRTEFSDRRPPLRNRELVQLVDFAAADWSA